MRAIEITVDPFDLVVDLAKYTRNYTMDDIVNLALSMLEEQFSPISVRCIEFKYILLNGYRRYLAALLIVSGFDHKDVHYCNPDFRLKAIAYKCTDSEAEKLIFGSKVDLKQL